MKTEDTLEDCACLGVFPEPTYRDRLSHPPVVVADKYQEQHSADFRSRGIQACKSSGRCEDTTFFRNNVVGPSSAW